MHMVYRKLRQATTAKESMMTEHDDLVNAHNAVMSRIEPDVVALLQRLRDRLDDGGE